MIYASFMSVLCQYYVGFMSVLRLFVGLYTIYIQTFTLILCQYVGKNRKIFN